MRPAPGTSPSFRWPVAADGPDDGGDGSVGVGVGFGFGFGFGFGSGVGMAVGLAAVPVVDGGLDPRLLRLLRDDLPPRPRPLPLPLPPLEFPLPLPPPPPDELIASAGRAFRGSCGWTSAARAGLEPNPLGDLACPRSRCLRRRPNTAFSRCGRKGLRS